MLYVKYVINYIIIPVINTKFSASSIQITLNGKGVKESPFSLTTAAGYQSTALKQADREPMGGFLWGLLVSVRQE